MGVPSDDNPRFTPSADGDPIHATDDVVTDSTSLQTKVGDDEEQMEEEIQQMVRELTRHSTHFSVGDAKNPFFEKDTETTWHPDNPHFSARDWIRSLVAAQSTDPERYRQRAAGVAFKNLHVHGFGSPTDFQADVLNSLLKVGDLVRYATGTGLKKVQILREFDGLVRSGEMLVVLGRPGR